MDLGDARGLADQQALEAGQVVDAGDDQRRRAERLAPDVRRRVEGGLVDGRPVAEVERREQRAPAFVDKRQVARGLRAGQRPGGQLVGVDVRVAQVAEGAGQRRGQARLVGPELLEAALRGELVEDALQQRDICAIGQRRVGGAGTASGDLAGKIKRGEE